MGVDRGSENFPVIADDVNTSRAIEGTGHPALHRASKEVWSPKEEMMKK